MILLSHNDILGPCIRYTHSTQYEFIAVNGQLRLLHFTRY